MTLRKKTLLAGGLTLAALIVVLYVVGARLLLAEFAALETQETEENMQRAAHVLDSILIRLDDALVGWSQWDDSYTFIRTNDPKARHKFIMGSLPNDALAQCKSDVIIYIRNNGQMVYGTGYDRKAAKKVPLPPALLPHLIAGSILLRHRDTQSSHRGIVLLPQGPLLLVSRPVVTNAGKGPIYGSLIWGRFLDSTELKEWSQLLELPLSMQRFDAPRLPSDFQMAQLALTRNSSKPYINALDEDTIAGYLTIKDFYGKPALLMRGDVHRDIYKQGQVSVRYLLLSVLTVGLIFGLLSLGALERWVLTPLSRLSRNVKQISASGDVSVRVPAEGHDELSQLSRSLNSLLAAGEQAQQELRAQIMERERTEQTARQARDEAVQAREEAEAAHAEAEVARAEAERANQAKSEFLSRMSHELRTPMNAILGFGQLLEMGELNANQREGVEHILKAGRYLLDLINEVLDLARIEAERFSISPEPVGVSQIIQESLDLVRPLATRQDITLHLEVNGNDEQYVQADRQRLKQVLINLLSNAIKYNRESGSVTVSCEVIAGEIAEHGETVQHTTHDSPSHPGPPSRLQIKVRDTGAGVVPDQLGKLFSPFERLGAEQGEIEGTGLGLAVSKRLVELMEGRIGVASVPGQGSTFWVELPLTQRLELPVIAELSQEAERSASSPTRRVLLYVEDNLPNVTLVQHILGGRPEVRLLLAGEGRQGLELARQHHPHLILLDLHLPDIMGDEVLRQLQASPATRDIPVVMISADATPRQIKRLLDAGARDYLTKPFDVRKFLQVVQEILDATDDT